jgi:hypothetical protein
MSFGRHRGGLNDLSARRVTPTMVPVPMRDDDAHQLIPDSSNQDQTEMDATTVAVDLAKSVFEVAIANTHGRLIARQRLNRADACVSWPRRRRRTW